MEDCRMLCKNYEPVCTESWTNQWTQETYKHKPVVAWIGSDMVAVSLGTESLAVPWPMTIEQLQGILDWMVENETRRT